MITIDPLMTNAKLKKLLHDEYGMEAPTGANKTKLLALLAENGAVVAGAIPETNPDVPKAKGKKRKYKIKILSDKDNRGPVPVGLNGKVTLIQRNKEVVISEAIYAILTRYSNRIMGEPMENGQGFRTYEQPAYAVTMLEVIDE